MPVRDFAIKGGTTFKSITGYVGDMRTTHQSEHFTRLRISIFEPFMPADFSDYLISLDVTSNDLCLRPNTHTQLEIRENDPITVVLDMNNVFAKEDLGLVLVYNHRNKLYSSAYLDHQEIEKTGRIRSYGLGNILLSFAIPGAAFIFMCVVFSLLQGWVEKLPKEAQLNAAFIGIVLFLAVLFTSFVIAPFIIKRRKLGKRKIYWQLPRIAEWAEANYQIVAVSPTMTGSHLEVQVEYDPTKLKSL